MIVAGPPGSGKSSLYPLSSFKIEFFNAAGRAAELNGTKEIRKIVNGEFEAFILGWNVRSL
jgi:hypothetical protein